MDLKILIAKGLKKILNPPALRKCDIDKTSKVCSKSELTRVKMARYSYIGNDCFLVNVSIGSFCSIADRCCIGGAKHPIDRVSSSPVFHKGANVLGKNFQEFSSIQTPLTVIENDVWIGIGAIVKAGVTIHNGAVVGMGSVVTHDVPAYEVWAGNPAHKLYDRFSQEVKQNLINSQWWNWDDKKIELLAQYFEKPDFLFKQIEDFC